MHLANRTASRVGFLREVSAIVLGFSECDVLELELYGDVRYRWQARRWPAESFAFDPGGSDQAGSDRSIKSLVEQSAREVLGHHADRRAGQFTRQGAFWTASGSKLHKARDSDATGHVDGPVDVVSLAIIPFEASERDYGLLRLYSRRPDVFTEETIGFCEALAQSIGMAVADRRAHVALRERVKELTCLYGISRVTTQAEGSTEASLEQIVKLLPAAWQFPDIAVARIVLDERCYSAGDFESARFRQSERIVVDGKDRGVVEVGYVAEIPEFVEGPFLQEEEDLLRAVAQEIVEFAEMDRAAKLRARLEEQVRHADRLATIGQLSAGIAHEINEPLAAILGCAQLARKAQDLGTETITDLDDIIAASLQAREVVSKLMLFARQRPPRKTLVNMSEVVRRGISILEARCAKEGVEMVQNLADDLPLIFADPAQLQQVLVNLVVNALQAMPEGGTLTIATCGDEQSAALVVEDTGVGMSEEIREQIFDPFFTTKDVGQGTGLGLSVVHGIVTSHGGTIECQGKLGCGTRFEVRFPRSTPQDPNGQEEHVSE